LPQHDGPAPLSQTAKDAVGTLKAFDADPYRLTGVTYDDTDPCVGGEAHLQEGGHGMAISGPRDRAEWTWWTDPVKPVSCIEGLRRLRETLSVPI
jgi:hypothetical protein